MDTKPRTQILWLIVFVVGATFQFWRSSPIDALIYSTVAALILLARQKWFENLEVETPKFRYVRAIVLSATLFFFALPIHVWLSTICFLLIVPAIMGVVMQKDSMPPEESTSALRKTAKIWFVIGVLTCSCELGNYFASDVTHDDKSYPTLTVLVDPFVADRAGKVVFVALWSWIGLGLFRIATTK